jgi:hypothetical protein
VSISKEDAMLARGAAYVAQATPILNPLERIQQLAE